MISSDDDSLSQTNAAQTLRLFAYLLLFAAMVTLGLRLYNGIPLYSLNDVAYPLITLCIAVLWLLHNRSVRTAAWLVFGGLLACVIFGARIYGMNASMWIALPIITMTAGWMLGARAALLMLAACCLSAIGIYLVGPPDPGGPIPRHLNLLIGYLTASIMGAVLGTTTAKTFRRQLDELRELSRDLKSSNELLEQRVSERTAELSGALQRLQQTQDDLIQAEKLASLGSMVAGIAHELNTPLGNALVVAGSLQVRANDMDNAMQSGTLKKSELASGLGAVAEMSNLIEKSVSRASTLVVSFKQVAVDQVSEHRREFDLRDTVEEHLLSIRPSYKLKPWIFENAVPAGIRCDGFPGPLGQVLVNLVQNAVLHAFAGRENGTVTVSASRAETRITLTVADDGVGMDTVTSMRIFEPFFTTKLGQGGSGLGLAVCYRIVTTILAGDIHVVSASGAGSQFIIHFPQRTPGKV